jgi:peptide/nickel transport system permease protein
MTVALVLVLAALLAPWLSPMDPRAVAPEQSLSPPSRTHWLGADLFGRDVLSRVLWGGRQTLAMSALATVITVVPGLLIGLASGYTGGWIDTLAMRVTDGLLALPALLLSLLLVAVLGQSWPAVALAVGLAGVPGFIRLARSTVLQVRVQPYILAAHAVGASPVRIVRRHVFPNLLGTLIVLVAIQIGWATLNAAALSYLRLGGPPADPEWGSMLNEGRLYLRQAPWVSLAPGICLILTVLSANLVGDRLRGLVESR